MKLNEGKTQAIIISNKCDVENLELEAAKFQLPALTKEIRTLGVNLDQLLTWEQHVNRIYKEGKQTIGMLYNHRAQLPEYLRLQLMQALILTKIDYCSIVFAGTYVRSGKLKGTNCRNCRIVQLSLH